MQGDPGRRRSLLILCVTYGINAVVILLVADHLSGNAWGRLQALMAKSQEGEAAQAQIDTLLSEPGVGTGVMLAVLLGTALSVPFWHAPAPVHWGSQSWGQALFSSTLAVWRCKGAYFLYGLGWAGVVMAFALLSALVFGLLGLGQAAGVLAVPAGLVFSAVFYLSVLFTFNDSFGMAVVAPDTIGEDPPAAAP